MFLRRRIFQTTKTWLYRPWIGRAPFISPIPPRPSLRWSKDQISECPANPENLGREVSKMQENQRERELQELHEELKETQRQMSDLRRLISRTHRLTMQELEDLRRTDELCK